jgi:integrase/recombinase XerD
MRIWSRGGDTPVLANPVPRGLLTRRQGGTMRSRTVPLVRVPRTLPRILPPQEADRLVAALRTHRDRAMVLGMLLAGLRRCEVLGLRFADVQVADRRLAVVEGKGGHHRVVRPRTGSSARSAPTWMTSGQPRHRQSGCLWC